MNIERCKAIVYEIQDALNAISSELSKPQPYNSYLQEKLRVLITDVPCLQEEFAKRPTTTNEEKFKAFEEVRQLGHYNMFDARAREMTGLSENDYLYVMQHYDELKSQYGGENE